MPAASFAANSLQNGIIEITLTGDTLPTAAPTACGFVGIAFRVAPDAAHFECIYLRPKDGRTPYVRLDAGDLANSERGFAGAPLWTQGSCRATCLLSVAPKGAATAISDTSQME